MLLRKCLTIVFMKETLEAKKNELLAILEQNQARLKEYENAVAKIKIDINMIYGGLGVIEDLIKETELKEKEVKND